MAAYSFIKKDVWKPVVFVDKLIDMGAKIILCDPHRATVIGINREYNLRGIEMSSPDIRAGVALLIAALSAEGKSVISNIHQIDRGYQYIDKRLQNLEQTLLVCKTHILLVINWLGNDIFNRTAYVF